MGYEITNTTELVLKARMYAKDVLDIIKEDDSRRDDGASFLPEHCFLFDMRVKAVELLSSTVKCINGHNNDQDAAFCKKCGKEIPPRTAHNLIDLPNFRWCGEGSGNSFQDEFRKLVAPKILGELQVILSWVGGEHVSGFAIKNGKICEPKVLQALELPEGW